MLQYMLDTNICIYLMKNQPPAVARRFAQCRVGDVMISAIILVTNNVRDFAVYPGIQIENWLDEPAV